MPRQTVRLLILLTAFTVTPAMASRRLPAAQHGPGCPHRTARAVAAAVSRGGLSSRTAVNITMTDRLPSDALVFGVGSMPRFFTP
jgi:hypothetical protein